MASIECSKDLDDRSFAQAEACHHTSPIIFDELHSVIRQDVLAADLRLSLFVSAAQNFKYESLLKPIPDKFKAPDGEVDISRLLSLVRKFPQLPCDVSAEIDPQVSELLLNILTPNSHRLNMISYSELLGQIGTKLQFSSTPPAYCFEIIDRAARKQNWERISSGHHTFFAFHGSRFENFYSILNLGLHQHLNKTSLFGKGIYLSTEQSLSQMYAGYGEGWTKSRLGPKLSILAICEVVDHPDVKKNKQRSTSASSVPEKYIVVPNNELVRVSYLLVYKSSSSSVASVRLNSFWQKHRFFLLIGFYAVLLLAIGMAKK